MISSVNCHSLKLSGYVDYHLQPIDSLRKLKPITEVPENSYLVILDVKSLYTSILNFKGIKAVKI